MHLNSSGYLEDEHGTITLPAAPDPYRYDYRGQRPADDQAQYRPLREKYAKPLAFNQVVPNQPQQGMSTAEYERALLADLSKHTERYARTDIAHLPLPMISKYRDSIVSEALQAPARRGELASYTYQDRSGREITEFAGPKSAWMNEFKSNFRCAGVSAGGRTYATVSDIPLSTPRF